MKRHLLTLLLLFVSVIAFSQADFTWKASERNGNELVITFTGMLDEGWHLNDQTVNLENSEGVELRGEPSVSSSEQGGRTKVVISQSFVITKEAYSAQGYLEYLICTDGMCLAPQSVDFDYRSAAHIKENPNYAAELEEKMKSLYEFFDPSEDPLWKPVTPEALAAAGGDGSDGAASSGGGGWRIFLLGFLGGLVALLTPCVWPIIPLTISFFIKTERGIKGAVLFGLSIIAIFMALAVGITTAFGANTLNQLSTSAAFNVACFIFLVIFGLSFIGLFSIALPQSWGNALDMKSSSTSGIVSIFLMALTLVVVSFSCTAPIVGTLLVEVASGGGSGTMIGLFAFSLALALPFMIFAMFPSALKQLPKSGDWMTMIKVTLGFLELAFSLKFLSVADMAYGWGILPRGLFLVIWILLFAMLGIYYIYKASRLWHGLLLAALPFALVIYLIPGLLGAPCTLVSAFAPPREDDGTSTTWDVIMGNDEEDIWGSSTASVATNENVYHDYKAAMEEAKRTSKRVFVDFTGYGCVNCRKMEAAVFTDVRVRDAMAKMVCVQLYVDDRSALPKPMRVTLNGNQRSVRTYGDLWSLLETYKFGFIAQPFYAILNDEGDILGEPYGYDESVENFLHWMSNAR
ncbi:MAG: thioredoxin family protein [Prevotella sp.]|nr:thioredoxin family protein [Prevotella sp.]